MQDAVVCTLVLCSVPQPEKVLREAARVLRPGGRFIFIEHVVDPQPGVRRVLQNLLNPVQNVVADSCNLNRDTLRTIESSGLFQKVDADRFMLEVDYFIAPHIAGVAYV